MPATPQTNLPASTKYVETIAEVRVTYGETDKMGVVYYGNYLRWFEVGRAEYLRARGKSYKELEAEGYLLPVVEAYSRYREPALYDDEVQIATIPEEIGPVRVKFGYRIIRKADQMLLADGHTIHVCTGGAGRARRLPEALAEILARRPL